MYSSKETILFFILFFALTCSGSMVLIRNVRVPQEQIEFITDQSGNDYFTGKLYYDLDSPSDSERIHIYLEEVPFKRYLIERQWHNGAAQFVCIDSLCRGDLGWVRSGKNHTVVWQYKPMHGENHCRIKVGTANLLLALTEKEYGTDRTIYTYNKQSLIQLKKTNSELDGALFIKPSYTKGGQLIEFDYSIDLYKRAYNSKEHLIWEKEGDNKGIIWHFSRGYSYDSSSRATQKYNYTFKTTPENPGEPLDTTCFTYDSLNRVVRLEQRLGIEQPLSTGDIFIWNGKDVYNYFYFKNNTTTKEDSMFRGCYDPKREDKLVSMVISRNFYNKDNFLDSAIYIQAGCDTIGHPFWSPDFYNEQRVFYLYNKWNDVSGHRVWHRYSPDSTLLFQGEYANFTMDEYDDRGNVIKHYENCDIDTGCYLSWEAEYDSTNHIIWHIDYAINGDPGPKFTYTWEMLNLDTLDEMNHE